MDTLAQKGECNTIPSDLINLGFMKRGNNSYELSFSNNEGITRQDNCVIRVMLKPLSYDIRQILIFKNRQSMNFFHLQTIEDVQRLIAIFATETNDHLPENEKLNTILHIDKNQ